MAKNEKPSGKGRIKFRFIEFEMDANDSTLQDAIKQITTAIARPQSPKAQPAQLTGSAVASRTDEIVDGEIVESENDQNEILEDVAATPKSDRARTKFRTPKIVQVEFLHGDMPLKKFLTDNSVDSNSKRYTLIAYWFKTYRKLPEITPDHIYTAFKHMGWTTYPKDVGGPLRALKSDGWFEKGDAEQTYLLNHIGESKAMEMLNPSA